MNKKYLEEKRKFKFNKEKNEYIKLIEKEFNIKFPKFPENIEEEILGKKNKEEFMKSLKENNKNEKLTSLEYSDIYFNIILAKNSIIFSGTAPINKGNYYKDLFEKGNEE